MFHLEQTEYNAAVSRQRKIFENILLGIFQTKLIFD